MGRSLRGVEDEGRRRPLGPGVVYGAFSLVLLAVVGLVSLSALQPPPPAIAEFAPQAQETITDAPSEQSSSFGSGTGDCPAGSIDCLAAEAAGGQTGQAAASPGPIDVPRVRRCVGSPPRQTEDPQSPPCVPYWDGDNGGATSRGVTRDGIIIAVPGTGEVNRDNPWFDNMLAHFNRRYEFYGRKLIPEVYSPRSGVEGMSADAAHVDVVIGAFASLRYAGRQGHESIHYDELARRGIISADNRPTAASEEHLARWHPYRWNYLPSYDRMARGKGAWTCSALRGRPAEFAAGAERGKPRVFGLIVSSDEDGRKPDTDPLRHILASCGVAIAEEAEIRQGGNASSQSVTAILNMRRSEVTTIICECNNTHTSNYLQPAADGQGYYPEWLISTFGNQDEDLAARANSQARLSFGQTWWNKQVPVEDSPWHWAITESDPNHTYSAPPVDYYGARFTYQSLLLVAAGVQLAGPELTPHTFALGLQRARFPNPGAGDAPHYQGHVGFAGDHTMVDDAALVWGDPSARNSYGGTGAWCYAGRGSRYGATRPWPEDTTGLFRGPCY